jgi:hypothetical protein
MIKTNLRTLLNSAGALNVLANQPLPARAGYRLGKIVSAVGDELKAYDAARRAACARYGPLNEKTGQYDIPDDKKGDFEREIAELQASEVEIGGDVLPLSAIESASVPAAALLALDWLIVDDAGSATA